MKKRILSLLLVLAAVFAFLPLSAQAAGVPAVSANLWNHEYLYGRWALPVFSQVTATDNGYTRVEYLGDSIITLDQYDKNFQFRDHNQLTLELPIYGGVYFGTDYNFVVCGQSNETENDSTEVIRVIRYSKDWKRQAAASVCGANTVYPFDGGSLRMVQSGDMLYIRTCHTMYRSKDGFNHQANVQLSVHIPDMEVTQCNAHVSNAATGYASHSFNQFIRADGTDCLAVDHGDAYPRSVILFRYPESAGQEQLDPLPDSVDVFPIAGNIGDNDTGVCVGGLEVSDTSYLVAGNSAKQDGTAQTSQDQRNIFVTVTPKDSFTQESTTIKWLTHYGSDAGVPVSNPHLVKISSTRFMILWGEGDGLHYALLDQNGTVIDQIYVGNAPLSDCAPIVADNQVVWYIADDSAPVFYTIDLAHPQEVQTRLPVFKDVAPNKFYYEPVLWAYENKIAAGVAPGRFAPENVCTRGQIVTFLWRNAGCPKPQTQTNPFEDVIPGSYCYQAVLWAVEQGITKGITESRFAPEKSCTRAHAVTFLWRANNSPAPVNPSNPFTDVKAGRFYSDAVLWAVENDITQGVSAGYFRPDGSCTRGQIVTFLYRSET